MMDIKQSRKKQKVWQDFKPTRKSGINTKPVINSAGIATSSFEMDIIEKEILLEKATKNKAYQKIQKKIKTKRKMPKPSFATFINNKKTIFIFLVLIVLLSGSYFLFNKMHSNQNDPATIRKRTVASKTPDYNTVLPNGKTIQNLGGWGRVSPPDKDPVFAYIDHIGAITIQVSEQPLPKEFHEDTAEQIQVLAEQYAAKDQITAGGIIAYIGTSSKGPQSVIFTKSNLLILIKSTSKIDDELWKQYISSLK